MEEKINRLQINRLHEIIDEAYQILRDLEATAKSIENNKFDKIPIWAVKLPNDSHRTRFVGACKSEGVYTIADLLNYTIKDMCCSFNFPNVGKLIAKEVKEALLKQYGIEWG